jgi:hypothetical protein
MAKRNIGSQPAATINSMVMAAINSLVEAAPLISSTAAAVINSKNSPAAASRNTPAAATMMAASATSSTAMAAINTHITAADISIVIPPASAAALQFFTPEHPFAQEMEIEADDTALADVKICRVGVLDRVLRGVSADKGRPPRHVRSSI